MAESPSKSDCRKKCIVCGQLPFRGRAITCTILAEHGALWDFDAGLCELMHRIDQMEAEEARLEPEIAQRTAKKVVNQCKRARAELIKAGLMHTEDQNYTGDNNRARMMAPFDWDEIEVGHLLGTGGFSNAFDIISFKKNANASSQVHPCEEAARTFLTEHAQRPVERKKKTKRQVTGTTPRYALKHLRQALTKEPGKFERAAIDLALETQLLLIMDHPNIICIRGWARQGLSAYRFGKHSDYFIILDKLTETLEDRIWTWRSRLKRYRSRMKLPWCKRKYSDKINNLFLERLKAVHDVACALEYMHDRRIINRDVKTANVGYDVHNQLKIYDFSLSRLLPPPSEEVDGGYIMSRVGTKYYMAPEIRSKEPYNLSADVYSFGVVLWEVLAMATPRDVLHRRKKQNKSEREVAFLLPSCEVCWPDSVKDLIETSLDRNPAPRPKISEARSCLRQEMEDLGMLLQSEMKRRRSSFRLDLSQMDSSLDRTTDTSSFGQETHSILSEPCLDSSL